MSTPRKALTIEDMKAAKDWAWKSYASPAASKTGTPAVGTPKAGTPDVATPKATTPAKENENPIVTETPPAKSTTNSTLGSPDSKPMSKRPSYTLADLKAGRKNWAWQRSASTEAAAPKVDEAASSNFEGAPSSKVEQTGSTNDEAAAVAAFQAPSQASEDLLKLETPSDAEPGVKITVSPKYEKEELEKLRDAAVEPVEDLREKVSKLSAKAPPFNGQVADFKNGAKKAAGGKSPTSQSLLLDLVETHRPSTSSSAADLLVELKMLISRFFAGRNGRSAEEVLYKVWSAINEHYGIPPY